MRLVILLAFLALALAVGCRSPSKRTVDQFTFLAIGTPMTVVSNRVGIPDYTYRGVIRWDYNLADGSAMAIVAEGAREPYTFETWQVIWFGQSRGRQWLWTNPPEVSK
jgi:hypothetical protein